MNFLKSLGKPFVFVLLFIAGVSFAQKREFCFNGYTQLRLFTSGNEGAEFKIRRIKMWIEGAPPKTQNLTYKVQGVINSVGSFKLLDAYAVYEKNFFSLRVGKQTPEFSLQRSQKDWKIPFVERARVVNYLIPAAQTNARDNGIQVKLNTTGKTHVTLGVFNGRNVFNAHNPGNFLYTARTVFVFPFSGKIKFTLGGAVSYQYVKNYSYSLILASIQNNFSGRDFRYDLSGVLNLSTLSLQAEYVEARLNKLKASGYYVLAGKELDESNQIGFIYEEYSDVSRISKKWVFVSYGKFIDGQKTKILFNAGKQLPGYFSAYLQFQFFFK